MYRRDILVFDDDADLNRANRHHGYRQYILWSHGRLGAGDRRVAVWKIKDKYPDPFEQYKGFVPGRFGWLVFVTTLFLYMNVHNLITDLIYNLWNCWSIRCSFTCTCQLCPKVIIVEFNLFIVVFFLTFNLIIKYSYKISSWWFIFYIPVIMF